MKCAQCGQKPKNRCNKEGFDCTGGQLDPAAYALPENKPFHNISEQMRAEHGNSLTRLEEIIEFAKRAGYTRLGVAFCIGLAREAEFIAKVFARHFKVESVCCKMGGLDKDEHGMSKIKPEAFEIACNPIGQAQMLNRAKTDLNIQLGLCLGHDILFQKYSEAPVTVLAVKDRALANNPMGVAYGSYWQSRLLG
ncbi:MAG: DUF1847 domain-containing protein [Proteobacteria bacterium]|nr:DUF1847 domain-containing protein [Pseudomonadota bacterium]MBU1738325.1 DUF1847 domain-containing protein [Pseudomonadota bacterium]